MCLSEIIASENELYLGLYSVCILCLIIVCYIIIVCILQQFLSFCFAECYFNSTFGSCGYFNLIHCERAKTTDSLACARVYSGPFRSFRVHWRNAQSDCSNLRAIHFTGSKMGLQTYVKLPDIYVKCVRSLLVDHEWSHATPRVWLPIIRDLH